MKDQFTEFLVVLGRSSRTQWLLIVGVTFALGTWLVGNWWIDGIELQGSMAPMTEAIQLALRDRYGGVALGILVAAVAGAVKTYRQDRKRLFQL